MPKVVSAGKRQAIREAIQAGITSAAIRELLSTSAGTIIQMKREMGIPIRPMRGTCTGNPVRTAATGVPPAPTAYTPQEYFEAIADGLRERDTENAALRYQVNELQTERRRILSDLNQCKLQMASWTGPVALPGRSLGNGG